MANRTEGHTFIRRPRTRYPWHEWADGTQWQIYKNEDYRIPTANMQVSLHGYAKAHGLKVRSNSFSERVPDPETGWMVQREGLIFQFEVKESVNAE